MNTIIDRYLKMPILYDTFVFLIVACVYIFTPDYPIKGYIHLPDNQTLKASEATLIGVSATITGLLVTILTIFVSFKSLSGTESNVEETNAELTVDTEPNTKFKTDDIENLITRKPVESFFNSKLYSDTARVINDGILLAVVLFIVIGIVYINVLKIPALIEVLIVLMVIWLIGAALLRCVYILRKIINLQAKAGQ